MSSHQLLHRWWWGSHHCWDVPWVETLFRTPPSAGSNSGRSKVFLNGISTMPLSSPTLTPFSIGGATPATVVEPLGYLALVNECQVLNWSTELWKRPFGVHHGRNGVVKAAKRNLRVQRGLWTHANNDLLKPWSIKAAAFARGEPSVSVPGCTVTNCGKLLTTTLRDTQRELCVLLCKGCTRTRVWDFSPSAGGVLYCKYIFFPLVLLRATTLTKDSTTTIAFLFSPSQVVDVIFVDESIYLN